MGVAQISQIKQKESEIEEIGPHQFHFLLEKKHKLFLSKYVA